jgi:hypothetical protein
MVLKLMLAVSVLFSRHHQIAVEIELLYLTYNTFYLTSNTTRVVEQYVVNRQIYRYLLLTMGSHHTKPVCMRIF